MRLEPELHERLTDFIHEGKKRARAAGKPLMFAGDAMATAFEFWLDVGAPELDAQGRKDAKKTIELQVLPNCRKRLLKSESKRSKQKSA